jgi:hypothetical protein
MNITIATSKTVHSTKAHGGTTCGAEFRKNRFGVGATNNLHKTDAEVTCKTCLKRAKVEASTQEVQAQAVETLKALAPIAPPLLTDIYNRRCACCQKTIRGTKEEISAHSAACWTAAKAEGRA